MKYCFLQKRIAFVGIVWCLVTLSAVECLAQDVVNKSDDGVSQEKLVSIGTDDFTYNPAGRRDPFVSLVKKLENTVAKPKVNLGPLGKYELGQLRLMAMLVVEGTPRAMVKAPDGKSYTIKLGDLVGPNGGVVTRIETKKIEIDNMTGQRIEKSPDRIVVVETGMDSYTGKMVKEERYIEM